MNKAFKIGDLVRKTESGRAGRVIGFAADGRVKVEFRNILWLPPDELLRVWQPVDSKDGDGARPGRGEEPQRRLSRLGRVERYHPD